MSVFKIIEDSPAVKVIREYGKFAVTKFDYVFLVKSLVTYSGEDNIAIFEESIASDQNIVIADLRYLLNQLFGDIGDFSDIADIAIDDNVVQSSVTLMRAIAKLQIDGFKEVLSNDLRRAHERIPECLGKELWGLIYFSESK